jgi:predicted ferric reductase
MLVFLCTFSIPWFRHRFYEIFVHSHIGAAIVYLGLMFWHAGMALDSWDYLWATLAVWLFSLCGRLLVKLKTPGFKGAEATLEDIDGEILKITIPAFEAFAKWKPGQHVFLRFPTISPVDNHPFTIASACDETYVTDRKGRTTRKPILFLIKPQKGITKRLMKIAQQDASPRTRPVLIEGPYGGHHCQFEYRYEQMILVAGGSGITAVLPLLTDLSRKIGRERTVIRQIKLIWAVKHKHALAWVRDQLHEALTTAPAGTVTIDYYVTSENSTSESSSTHTPDAEKAVPQLPDDGKQVEVHEKNDVLGPGLFGRPVLRQLIPAALEHERICVVGKSSPLSFLIFSPKLIVIGCGPKGMNQDLSNAVATCQTKVLRGEVQEVALHTETFGW